MSFSVIPIVINNFYYANFLALEKASAPLIGGIISGIVMVVGMISLGSMYGATGIAVTVVLTYSVLLVISYIMNKRLNGKKQSSD